MSTRRRISKQKNKAQAKKNGLFIIGGVILLAIVVVAGLVWANLRPTDPGEFITVEKGTWPQADGKALGAADAPVVLREFSDFQCPYCRQFSENIQKQIINDYVATGKVRFEYHHYIVIDGNVGGKDRAWQPRRANAQANRGCSGISTRCCLQTRQVRA